MPRRDRKTYKGSTHTRAIVRMHHDDFPERKAVEFTPSTTSENHLSGMLPDPPPVPSVPPGVASLGGHGSSVRRISGRLLAVSTQKNLGAPMGNFSFTIKKNQKDFGGRSLLRVVKDPEDIWVEIIFLIDGQTFYTMLGLVDAIKESTVRSGNGQRSETYVISGSDFGKVFDKTSVFVNYLDSNAGVFQYAAVYNALESDIGGTPERVVRALIHTWLKNKDIGDQSWTLPQSFNGSRQGFGKVLVDRIQQMDRGNGFIFDKSLLDPNRLSSGQSLWSVLQEYCNPVLNEMWVDVQDQTGLSPIPGLQLNLPSLPSSNAFEHMYPAFFLRERPFPTKRDHSRWESLRINRLELKDVNGREITKGGVANRYNYWMLQPTSLAASPLKLKALIQGSPLDGAGPGNPGHFPIYSVESIEKHGMRKWEESTKYLPFLSVSNRKEPKIPAGVPNEGSIARLAANWLRKCHDWYVVGPLELTGTIKSSRIMPEAHVGERLKEDRFGEPAIVYYIEGVSHEWSYPGTGSSTFTLTRGEYESEDLLHLAYEQYENSFGTFSNAVDDLAGIGDKVTAADAAVSGAAQHIDTALDVSGANAAMIGSQAISALQDDEPLANQSYPAVTAETLQARSDAEFGIPLPAPENPADLPVPAGEFGEDALEAGKDIALGGGVIPGGG